MKIVQTPVRFYPFTGGVENYVYDLSKELVRRGHDISVICANEPKSKKEEVINGIRVKRISFAGKISNTNITPGLPFELLREDFDLIHAHLPTPWSADWSAIISIIKRKPLVLTYYNDIVGYDSASRLAQLYNHTSLHIVLKRANRIIIIQPNYLHMSPYLREYGDKIEVISAGVDVDKFRPIEGPLEKELHSPTLFFLSVLDRYHKYKGLDDLLRALAIVKAKINDVKLVVGGDGALLNHYRNASNALGLEQNVDFVGFIPDDAIVRRYNECDMFVLPSLSPEQEGFGMVLLEAMACGKPVVSTEIVGVAEDIKRTGAGIIVERGNVESLAQAILDLLQNRDLAVKMGAVGRKLVEENYNWGEVAKRFEHVYRDLLSTTTP